MGRQDQRVGFNRARREEAKLPNIPEVNEDSYEVGVEERIRRAMGRGDNGMTAIQTNALPS